MMFKMISTRVKDVKCISILPHVMLVSRIQNDETHPVTISTFKKVENLCCQFIFHKMRPKCNLIKRKVLISHISLNIHKRLLFCSHIVAHIRMIVKKSMRTVIRMHNKF